MCARAKPGYRPLISVQTVAGVSSRDELTALLQREQEEALSLIESSPIVSSLLLKYARGGPGLSNEGEEVMALRAVNASLLEDLERLRAELKKTKMLKEAAEVTISVLMVQLNASEEEKTSLVEGKETASASLKRIVDELEAFKVDVCDMKVSIPDDTVDIVKQVPQKKNDESPAKQEEQYNARIAESTIASQDKGANMQVRIETGDLQREFIAAQAKHDSLCERTVTQANFSEIASVVPAMDDPRSFLPPSYPAIFPDLAVSIQPSDGNPGTEPSGNVRSEPNKAFSPSDRLGGAPKENRDRREVARNYKANILTNSSSGSGGSKPSGGMDVNRSSTPRPTMKCRLNTNTLKRGDLWTVWEELLGDFEAASG
jgi:hypothetical protein